MTLVLEEILNLLNCHSEWQASHKQSSWQNVASQILVETNSIIACLTVFEVEILSVGYTIQLYVPMANILSLLFDHGSIALLDILKQNGAQPISPSIMILSEINTIRNAFELLKEECDVSLFNLKW